MPTLKGMSHFSSNKRKCKVPHRGTAQGAADIGDQSPRRTPAEAQKIRVGCPARNFGRAISCYNFCDQGWHDDFRNA